MYINKARLTAQLTVISLFQNLRPTTSYQNQMMVHSDRNKVMYGHSYFNVSSVTMQKCLGYCLANCSCLSFQMCGGECQLCSSSKYLNPQAMRDVEGCSSYNFGSRDDTEARNEQCSSGCSTNINCCMTSNPCLNGGTCVPLEMNSERRFTCRCSANYEGQRCETKKCDPPGYTGENCDQPVKSCRGYSRGNRIPGIHTILDKNKKPFNVICDFDEKTWMTWTLVQSYDLSKKGQFQSPLFQNKPKAENDPSWHSYRLSKSRMESIQQDSTKWRITCRYNTDGVVYTDYVRGSNDKGNIVTHNTEGCINLEYINIRGEDCTDCSAYMSQSDNSILHFDSYYAGMRKECDFKPNNKYAKNCEGKLGGEDNFGHYDCVNPKHRCSSSNKATTQTWFGGE